MDPAKFLATLLFAFPLTALAQGGSVTGTVDVTPAKYQEETVVYLRDAPAAAAPRTALMDQKGLRFLPRVLVITVGDSVHFANHDTVAHNVFSPDQGGYNLGNFNGGDARDYTFHKPGAYVQLCAMHPEMLAYVYVSPTPYAAAVGKDGRFTLADVPPGTYHVAVWNSHLSAPEQSVTVAAGKPSEIHFALHR